MLIFCKARPNGIIMKVEDDEVSLIIRKAQDVGSVCQKNNENKWTIYLKGDYVLSQTETQWLLSVEGNFELCLCHFRVMEFLEDLK